MSGHFFYAVWKQIKCNSKLDSAFFRTQSYITEICYSEYLLSFGLQKKNIYSPVTTLKYKTLIKFVAPTLDFFSIDPPIHMKS